MNVNYGVGTTETWSYWFLLFVFLKYIYFLWRKQHKTQIDFANRKILIGLINCYSVCQKNSIKFRSSSISALFMFLASFIFFIVPNLNLTNWLMLHLSCLFKPVATRSHRKEKKSAYNGSARSLCYQILNRQLCSPRHDQHHWWVLSVDPPEVSANGINGQWRMKWVGKVSDWLNKY